MYSFLAIKKQNPLYLYLYINQAWLEELATNAENHASECVHQPSLPTAREITALSVLIGEHLHASYNDPNQAVIAEVRTILEEGESEFQGNGGSCDGLSAMEAYKCTYYLQVLLYTQCISN